MSETPEELEQDEPADRKPARRRILLTWVLIAAMVLLAGGGALWGVLAAQASERQHAAAEAAAAAAAAEIEAEARARAAAEAKAEAEAEAQAEVERKQALDDPSSVTVVVNKQRPLKPIDWAPDDLVQPDVPTINGQPLRHAAATALEKMYAAANQAGVPFYLLSGYRDYDMQKGLFNDYAAADGVAAAETYSARPGHSEHQTGLAADLTECGGCGLSEAFGSTPQGVWLKQNAYRYGFILRYDQGQEPVVGFVFEPWHFRYVGVDVATDMHRKGVINLEEYFGLPAAPKY